VGKGGGLNEHVPRLHLNHLRGTHISGQLALRIKSEDLLFLENRPFSEKNADVIKISRLGLGLGTHLFVKVP